MGDRGYPIIKIKNVVPPTVDIIDCERVPESIVEEIPNIERYALEPGDILIAMTGATVGKVGRFPLTHERFYLNQRVGKVYLTAQSKADYRYLYYVLSQDIYVRQIFGAADGSAQANISGAQIERLQIPFPPLLEQVAIAHILGTLDDKIELNRRMNETLETMARVLFKSWFVDFRPVRAKAEGRDPGLLKHLADLFPDSLEDSELGEIPKGWEVQRVGEVGSIVCGKTPPTQVPEYYGDDVPFITIPDMHGRIFATAVQKRLSRAGAKSQEKKMLPAGALCVSCIATAGLVVITSEAAQTNQQINSVVPAQKDAAYFWFWSLRGLGEEIRARGSGGSVLTNLSTGRFAELRLLAGQARLRSAYNALVTPIFGRILANERESQTLAALRDALLPKLISGEFRVKDAERFLKDRGL